MLIAEIFEPNNLIQWQYDACTEDQYTKLLTGENRVRASMESVPRVTFQKCLMFSFWDRMHESPIA